MKKKKLLKADLVNIFANFSGSGSTDLDDVSQNFKFLIYILIFFFFFQEWSDIIVHNQQINILWYIIREHIFRSLIVKIFIIENEDL